MNLNLKKVVLSVAAVRALGVALIFFGAHYFPFHEKNYELNFHYPTDEAPSVWTSFKTWDAQHYLYLAEKGYSAGQMSNAFYPLYPVLIRLSAFLFGGSTLLAGLILSNFFSVLAVVYLFLMVKKKFDPQTAWLSCLLLLAFPTGFYGGLVYTEALFLLLSTAFFYYWGEKRRLPALACAFLLPLSRPTGILILAPILTGIFLEERNGKSAKRGNGILMAAGAASGFFFYLILMRLWTGDYGAGFEAQSLFFTGHLKVFEMTPWRWFWNNFIALNYSLTGFGTSLADRVSFAAFLLAVPWMWKKLPRDLFVYALALGLASALSMDLTSYARYLSVIFPFFILLALQFKKVPVYYWLFCLPLQATLLILHSLNDWVG